MSQIVPTWRCVPVLGFGAMLLASACGASRRVELDEGSRDAGTAVPDDADGDDPLDSGTNASDAAADPPRTRIPDDWDPELDCLAQKVSVGASHACAITRGGHLFCWGANGAHQLGASSGAERCDGVRCARAPVPVVALSNVTAVSMATAHTCAIHGGIVSCWGSNESGSLGIATAESCADPWGVGGSVPCSATPSAVPGVGEAVDIDGWGRTCVAEQSGVVQCWGWEGLSTAKVVSGVENARSVEDGCALTHDGEALCWGSDMAAVPVAWNGNGSECTKGYNQVCIVDDEARLHCWGLDLPWSAGARVCLGCEPTLVPNLPLVAQVSGSLNVTWFRDTSGNVLHLAQDAIRPPLELPSAAIDLSAGYFAACAVLEDGRVYCWPNPGVDDTAKYGLTSGTVSEVRLCPE